jgi:hypothetical protein
VAEPRIGCQVEYLTKADSGSTFAVDIRVVNTGALAIDRWVLTFAYPGNQQVTNVTPGEWVQEPGVVTVRGGELAADGSATLSLVGTYSGANPMPTGFWLNGRPCGQLLVGIAAPPEPADAGRPAGGGGGGGGGGTNVGGSNRSGSNDDDDGGGHGKGKDKDKDKDKDDDEGEDD